MTDRNSRTEKKKMPTRWIRLLLHLCQHAAAVTAAFCVATILIHTSIVAEDMGSVRRYKLDLLGDDGDFEDSYLFLEIFRQHVNDVIEYVVIENQIGTDGVYDGDKLINISDYANRKDLTYDGSQPAAFYRVEDLLKWSRDGIRYVGKQFYGLESIAAYLPFYADQEVEGVVNSWIEYTDAEDASVVQFVVMSDGSILFSNNFLQTLTSHGIDYSIAVREDEKGLVATIRLPEDKYMTADGRALKECAGDWEEYGTLINNLQASVYDLGYNYDIYLQMQEGISRQNTNMRYHVEIEKDGVTSEYTNDMGIHPSLHSYYRQMEKYVIYDPYNLFFETNIPEFDEGTLRAFMAGFEYTFGDSSRVFIGVDLKNGAEDIYVCARDSYAVMNNIWIYGGVILLCLLVWIVLLAYLSVTAGRKRTQEGIVSLASSWFDYVPTEMILALMAALGFLGRIEYLKQIWQIGREHIAGIIVGLALVVSVLFAICWYSLVRRLKMHILWKNSIVGFLCRTIWKTCRAGWRGIQARLDKLQSYHGAALTVLLPYVLLLVGNLGVGFWGIYCVLYGYGWGIFQDFVLGWVILAVLVLADGVCIWQIVKNVLVRKRIVNGILLIRDGNTDYQLDTEEMHGQNLELANAVNSIGTGIKKAVETSMKDERLKADLITNVSHDIKTPLTSIINYVDLLKREKIETQPVKGYIEVLDAKSQRLKQLTDDLVEASKISSGNIVLNIERIDLIELLKQSVGEFSEKFEQKNLTVLENYGKDPHLINADSRRMWRVVENLFSNVCKYALEGTRVYIDIMRNRFEGTGRILLSIKNISAQPLNISPEELTERFIRGDESRTTEGSGLGLSIAKSLTEAQGGTLNIILDGDLFKVVLLFEEANAENTAHAGNTAHIE